jgi:hypothetical protein
MLLNLLSNAVKFTRGRIEIALSEQAGGLRVDVRDNGPGIDPADHAVVFDKFRQARDQADAEGSGLGLHISRQIVEHFGGRMWVESAPGRGACFSFTRGNGVQACRRFAGAHQRRLLATHIYVCRWRAGRWAGPAN